MLKAFMARPATQKGLNIPPRGWRPTRAVWAYRCCKSSRNCPSGDVFQTHWAGLYLRDLGPCKLAVALKRGELHDHESPTHSGKPLSRAGPAWIPSVLRLHHDDSYPASNGKMGVQAVEFEGREMAATSAPATVSMYHGEPIPGFPATRIAVSRP